MLFHPDRHEPLCHTLWHAEQAHDAIRSIARDVEQHRVTASQWPVHPLDDEGDTPATGFKGLYLGAAGVLWALWYLQREGAVELGSDPTAAIQQVDAAYQADPDTGTVVPSYYLGEVGILLALWRLTGSAQAADRLHAAVLSNILNPTNEALWAAPGTMVAAWHLWQATREARWRDLFVQNVEQLWQTWVFDPQAQCHLWTQDLYGKTVQYLGAGHGFAGNASALLRGAALLDVDRREALFDRCVATLRATARCEDGAVNWPPGLYAPQPGRPSMLMQWCHGAPGMVTALADFPPLKEMPGRPKFPCPPRGAGWAQPGPGGAHESVEMDSMLAAAGQAIWDAGPLAKGYGLCHGTAGNGVAFLTLYRRTGNALWLERARSFAMHAIAQWHTLRQQHGQGRYTLWTGDAGLAVYLWHCLQGRAGLPALDIL